MTPIQLGDARDLPFKDGYFGLAFFSPPWDDLEVFFEAQDEIQRVLKKRGRWAVILPHKTDPALAVVAIANRDRSDGESFTIPRPSQKIGPNYFSVDEDVVHQVLDRMPWVARVIDPFCGMGTIVRVARARGLEAYGVDIDPETVKAARQLMTVIDSNDERAGTIVRGVRQAHNRQSSPESVLEIHQGQGS